MSTFAKRLLPLLTALAPLLAVGQAPPFPTNPPQPGLNWSTYCGDTLWDGVDAIAADGAGNLYIAGQTLGLSNWVDATAFQPSCGGLSDGFIAKLDWAGHRLWATYVGGAGWDLITAADADRAGNVIVTGFTDSPSGIASAGAFQTNLAPVDTNVRRVLGGFVAKFGPDGQRLWSTYVDGISLDEMQALAVDSAGNIYVAGSTDSPLLGTAGTYQPNLSQYSTGVRRDAFLIKFDPSGNRQWATYLGSPLGYESIRRLKVNNLGQVILWGSVRNGVASMATLGAYQPAPADSIDAMLACFDSQGRRVWLTYYGGLGTEDANGLALSASGRIYVAGNSGSGVGLGTPGSFRETRPAVGSAPYLACFSSMGQRLWGTYFADSSASNVLACDSGGTVFWAGQTRIHQGLATYNVFQTQLNGTSDMYLARFTPQGGLDYATYFGGDSAETAGALAYMPDGILYLAGFTNSDSSIATSGAFQDVYHGGRQDGFLSQWDPALTAVLSKAPTATLRAYPNPAGSTLTVQSHGTALIQLYAPDGKLVLMKEAAQGQTVQVDMSTLPAGLYQLRQGTASARIVRP